MLKRSDMSLLGSLPVGADFGSPHAHNQGLTVRFKSVVKQLDESQVKAKHWKNEVKEEMHLSTSSSSSSSSSYHSNHQHPIDFLAENTV